VLLSQNGFDADHKLASRIEGPDVILSSHGEDVLPDPVRGGRDRFAARGVSRRREPLRVSRTLIAASGSYGKFVSRLDLDVRPEGLRDFRYKLIPLVADGIHADADNVRARGNT